MSRCIKETNLLCSDYIPFERAYLNSCDNINDYVSVWESLYKQLMTYHKLFWTFMKCSTLDLFVYKFEYNNGLIYQIHVL